MTRARATGVLALTLAAALAAAPARAQRTCDARASASPPARRSWSAPLDRPVTLRARDVTLREALDRLSAAARVGVSYSSDLLPLDRRVCVDARARPLGDALTALLAGTGVRPELVAGQVVLAPGLASTASEEEELSITERVNELEAIVVTGSVTGMPRRSVTVGLDVIDGETISRRSASSISTLLNGTVPGVWAWRQSPASVVAQYGSVRGASSFGATYPKVYVDGIEAANPLLVTEIDPDEVERVEVIRGPQGAALYGSGAISGVINIITRHEGAEGAAALAELRTRAGVAGSDFADDPLRTQEQRVAVRTGNNLRSAGGSLTFGTTGALYPGADSRRLGASANARWVLADGVVNATARFSDRRAGVGVNPLLAGMVDSAAAFSSTDQSVRLYTVGANATLAPRGAWTHTLLAGVDGFRLDYLPDAMNASPLIADSILRANRGAGDRGTLRASSTLRLGDHADPAQGAVTLALEHSVLRQRSTRTAGEEPRPPSGPQQQPQLPSAETFDVVEWRHATGLVGQASGSWRDAWFATAGARLERSDAFAGGSEVSLLPMLGAAWTGRAGGAELKLRAAYGRGIRPPRTPARDHLRPRAELGFAGLEPEAQSGIEVGAELYLARALSLQATRFDQRVTGLIQDVLVGVDSAVRAGRREYRPRFALQNVGAIDNRGWEMRGAWSTGPLALSATLALVDSRVRRLADGYGGDLRPGDRMLAVPARTAGLAAEWDGGGWTASLAASRAWDWINYDRLELAADFAADTGAARRPPASGARLRDYWRAYDGSTELDATLSREVRAGVWLVATGQNLLGGQLGEPDNITIRAGRTLTLGARAEF